jgi:hypothetical protein
LYLTRARSWSWPRCAWSLPPRCRRGGTGTTAGSLPAPTRWQRALAELAGDDRVTSFRFAVRGHFTTADAFLAASAAQRARDHRLAARDAATGGDDAPLTADEIEAIAQRVAELVERPRGLVDAEGVADDLEVERDWVYGRACEQVRLGRGGVETLEAVFGCTLAEARRSTSATAF